jgi:hypothetical protein
MQNEVVGHEISPLNGSPVVAIVERDHRPPEYLKANVVSTAMQNEIVGHETMPRSTLLVGSMNSPEDQVPPE